MKRWTGVMLAVALTGCGPAEKTKPKTSDGADPAKATLLVNEAKSTLDEGKFEDARKLLDEANRFSDAEVRHHIDLTNKEIDKAEAATVGDQAIKLAADGKCQQALDMTAAMVSGREGTEVPKRIRAHTEKAHIECVSSLLEGGKLSDAQSFIASTAMPKVLDGKAASELRDDVHGAVLSKLLERITPAMADRKWSVASATLVKSVKDGEALPAERDELLAQVRIGIAEDVKKLVDEYFEEPKGAKEALARVDALIEAGFYRSLADTEKEEDDRAEGQEDRFSKLLHSDSAGGDKPNGDKPNGDKPNAAANPNAPSEPVPDALRKLRRELALWVVCGDVRCKVASVKALWLYGKAPLVPAFAPDDKPLRELKHGRMVWRIATAGNRVLVSRQEPGKDFSGLRPRAQLAWGWLPANEVRTEDTSEWLPPGDDILGSRVWGPLRAGDKTYELGTVTGVDGTNIQVQRLADRDVMIVARAALHFGIVKKGLKVLAFCEPTKQQEAIIESVKLVKHQSQGDSRATVNCLDASGNTHKTQEDSFGALRIKPEWLPRRR